MCVFAREMRERKRERDASSSNEDILRERSGIAKGGDVSETERREKR